MFYHAIDKTTGVAPYFSSVFGKSGEIGPFFGNPAKSGSGEIFSRIRIWRIPVRLHRVQLITVKTNAADLSSGAFTFLISVTWIKKTL